MVWLGLFIFVYWVLVKQDFNIKRRCIGSAFIVCANTTAQVHAELSSQIYNQQTTTETV